MTCFSSCLCCDMSDTDEENPPMSSSGFWFFKDPDPGFSQTCISVAANFVLSNMLIYGITGRGRLSYLVSMATIPCSVILSIQDSQKDFEKWNELKLLRIKGVPERFLPYKSKYDWSDYERKLQLKEVKRSE